MDNKNIYANGYINEMHEREKIYKENIKSLGSEKEIDYEKTCACMEANAAFFDMLRTSNVEEKMKYVMKILKPDYKNVEE